MILSSILARCVILPGPRDSGGHLQWSPPIFWMLQLQRHAEKRYPQLRAVTAALTEHWNVTRDACDTCDSRPAWRPPFIDPHCPSPFPPSLSSHSILCPFLSACFLSAGQHGWARLARAARSSQRCPSFLTRGAVILGFGLWRFLAIAALLARPTIPLWYCSPRCQSSLHRFVFILHSYPDLARS